MTDGEGTSYDEVVFRVRGAEEDDGPSTTVMAGVAAIAIVAVLVLLLAMTGRLGGKEEEPPEEPEEERWEPISEDDFRSKVHR
ncbi:MAG: hypothetical protein GWN18_16165 [Thermoplasmata archaeon]|nr:hypothetical protein [Thermoplasmata archaeon]NIS13609.1 hypothetical protein [Thermoplasmata archaeon]NIS21478.1 hypothetical protein [Thermoplasmata archaeon]NIT79042.1 hypothetical protein [Thermoplasmata archaeon]NIU50527.1 hypothetical protein [Thermoplasmata archaeon]